MCTLLFHRVAAKMSANRLPLIILGNKRENATEGYRKLHNKVLQNLYSLPNKIRMKN